MKTVKFLLPVMALFGLPACFNKADIPSEIKANAVVSGETTSRVVHTVEISAQLEQLFRAECESLAIQAGLQRETPPFETYVASCIATKSQAFMAQLLQFIQEQQQQQGNQEPQP